MAFSSSNLANLLSLLTSKLLPTVDDALAHPWVDVHGVAGSIQLVRYGEEVPPPREDISHLNDAGFWDLVEIVKKPMIASHSSCRALCDHPRNLTDEQIEAMADRGGVVGVAFAPNFIHPVKATVERVVDHIDHIVDLVGVDHVGLGSDFDGISTTPEGLEDVTRMSNVTKVLVERGYSEGDVRRILGENHLRVFKQVIG